MRQLKSMYFRIEDIDPHMMIIKRPPRFFEERTWQLVPGNFPEEIAMCEKLVRQNRSFLQTYSIEKSAGGT